MARIIQVLLLPLVCVVLAEAHYVPGLPYPARPILDGPRDNRPIRKNDDYNGGYDTSFQHFGNPDEHSFNSDSHERDQSYEDYEPFYQREQGNGWDQMPGINNVFNIPNSGYNFQKLEEKSTEIPQIDKNPTDQVRHKGPKMNEDKIPDVTNDPDVMLPKTNEIKNEDKKADEDSKQVGLDKKKDFLLVGQGNNGNNIYLLHENIPNPSTVIIPNANQPGNNIIYVPYNPGQTNTPVYQVINGQPASLPTNVQTIQRGYDKSGVSNGYNNVIPNPGQSNTNLNTGNQNPGYVTISYNGQLIQIPGRVVNSAPNNVPLQNGNQGQGTNYIIANTVPNNVQTVPAIQNPGTNVVYATIPNQASNGQIYVQVPNCVTAMTYGCGSSTVQGVNNGISSNGLPSNVVLYQTNPSTVDQSAVLPNDVSNSYVQPNVANQGQGAMTVAIPNQSAVFSSQNGPYQLAVALPVNSGTNGYSQPIVSNLGQGQNAPNQRGMMNNQNMPIQTAVQQPVGNNNNGYYKKILSNQGEGQNILNQGAIQIPIPKEYNVNPPVTNPNPTVSIESRGDLSNNQNVQPPRAVTVNRSSNRYQQPQVTNQGDQGTNAIVNNPKNGEVINQESDNAQPLATSSQVLDSNNLSSLGAQQAIMISDLKDKSGDKEDKKEKKDKGKDNDMERKKDEKPKVSEPFTNKTEDVKR